MAIRRLLIAALCVSATAFAPTLSVLPGKRVKCTLNRATSLNMALWEKIKDPASGEYYYYDRASGATQWDAPDNSAKAAPKVSAPVVPMATRFDVKEFERSGRIVPLDNQELERSPNPLLKVASFGMSLLKPVFAAEASLQAAALSGLAKVSASDVLAEIQTNLSQNPCLIYTYKLSPFSAEALALLDASGYKYTNIELGLEWFVLGGRGSQTRVELAGMCENGATSLPKIFIGGKSIGGAGGFSALAELVENGELEPLLKAAGAGKK